MSAPALTTAVDAPTSAGDALRHAADTLHVPRLNKAIGQLDLARRLNYAPADVAQFERDLAVEAVRLADLLHAAAEMDRLETPARPVSGPIRTDAFAHVRRSSARLADLSPSTFDR